MSEPFGVVYLLIGCKHAALLAVSIRSLREHYSGPVAILAGDDDAEQYARRIATDHRAGDVRVIRWQFISQGRGSVYLAKTRMHELSPFERSAFLDADTLVQGDFSAMAPVGNEVRLTAFAGWRTTGKRMTGRLMSWKDAAPVLVARMVQHAYPAINTGVVGFSVHSVRFFAAWRALCERRISFICDELAAQLIYPDFPHRILDDAYNWCPVYSVSPVEDARIIHFHGGVMKVVEKPAYRQLWLPAFQRAVRENFGSVAEWAQETLPKSFWEKAKLVA